MTLKERLEAVWNDQRIACPCHLAAWNEEKCGYYRGYGLYYTKGKLVRIKTVP